MNPNTSASSKSDFFGIFTALLCAVHCSILPILLAMGSLSTLAWMQQEWVEMVFLIGAIVISSWSIVPNLIKNTAFWKPAIYLFAGLVVLIYSFLVHTHDGNIRYVSLLGGALVCVGHLINYRMSKRVATIA